MKSALLLLALFVGVALAQNGTQVCLPWTFQWQREQQFQVFANNGYGGFDLSEEWYDYTNKNFHYRTHIWENNGEEIMQDLYIIGAAKKLYTINATKGSGSVTCTVQAAGFPPSWPCLLSNASIVGSFYIAGDVFTQVYSEQITTSENITVYQDIALTAEDNVPINSREFYTGEAATFELYFNYALNLDADAFTIPSICPSGFETITEAHPSFMTEKDIRGKFRWLRNAPPAEKH